MDLVASAWMTRSLGEPVASVTLEEDGTVLVGGWDGSFKRWNEQGDLVWSTQLNDRVNDVAVHDDCLVATAGLHLVCLERATGEIRWSHPLEGSSDAVVVHGGTVYAVSSVYDIEHNDFIESAVWSFGLDGVQNWIQRMDERPWTMMSFKGDLWIGLGRPRCGFALVQPDGTLVHSKGPVDSPVTSGDSNHDRILFGHADGTVSDDTATTVYTLPSGVESVACVEGGSISADEQGTLHAHASKGDAGWTSKGHPVEAQCEGFAVKGELSHWVARWSGMEGSLEILNGKDGSSIAEDESMHVRFLQRLGDRIVAGCENGDVHVWDADVFERRLSATSKSAPADENPRKSALQDKLRKLRER
tara:strand:- start:371 stop:1450 length:1080 start_codon:yes stop_codon:yes gene_type:complete